MAFSWSVATGCNNNSNDTTYNPSALTTEKRRAAGVNEIRKAIEEWYTNNNTGSVTWANTSTNHAFQDIKIRAAHYNEMRVAINKLRMNSYACSCNGNCNCQGNCSCTCNSVYGCTCAGTCDCNVNTTWYSTMAAFSFSNTGADGSGAGTRIAIGDKELEDTIAELEDNINTINDNTTLGGRAIIGNGLTF